MFPGYGLAEATLGVTIHLPGDSVAVDERGNVSCGAAIAGFELRAGAGVEAPEEILVRGDAIFAGYLDAPEETAAALRGGWLHTGDSGYLDAEGRLFVLGRRRGMLKRGGAVVAPRELEEAAQAVPGVRVAAAMGVPVGAGPDETITLVVEADASDAGTTGDVAAEVTRRVVESAGFAPGRVAVVPRGTIRRTVNGKIRHGTLLAALAEGSLG